MEVQPCNKWLEWPKARVQPGSPSRMLLSFYGARKGGESVGDFKALPPQFGEFWMLTEWERAREILKEERQELYPARCMTRNFWDSPSSWAWWILCAQFLSLKMKDGWQKPRTGFQRSPRTAGTEEEGGLGGPQRKPERRAVDVRREGPRGWEGLGCKRHGGSSWPGALDPREQGAVLGRVRWVPPGLLGRGQSLLDAAIQMLFLFLKCVIEQSVQRRLSGEKAEKGLL